MSRVHTSPVPTGGSPHLSRRAALAQALSCQQAGYLPEAGCYLEDLLSARAQDADALHLLGIVRDAQGDATLGAALIGRALVGKVTPEFLSNHGMVLGHLGRHTEALARFDQALAAKPNYPEALNNKGISLEATHRATEAVEVYRLVCHHRPNYPEALANLGHALLSLNQLAESAEASTSALALRPDFPEALTQLAIALRGLGLPDAAEQAAQRALALLPRDIACHRNLAITLQMLNRPLEALAVLDLALAIAPQDPETHHHRAILLLRAGRFTEGWDEYEWRFKTRQAREAHHHLANSPVWRGEDIAGRTILLIPEQGLGDTIQFVRYAAMLAAWGARVILQTQPPLARLLHSLRAEITFIPMGTAPDQYDVQCPLLSLPRAFGTDVATIPAMAPYLYAEPEAVERWRQRLHTDRPGLRVGIVWAGNPRHIDDRQRSLAFAHLAPLWQVPGVRWFSLQMDACAADLQTAPDNSPPSGIDDLSLELADFAETAAALESLDLLITVDTAIAHLAGALGRPVWVMLPEAADWRWMSGETSPWYPTMRLFRQDRQTDWTPVLHAVASELGKAAIV